MKSILKIGGPWLELNALFIQPTRWCALNCKGCYVKEHTDGEDGYHTPWEEQFKLFKLFYEGPHWANQITISVDDMPLEAASRARHMALVVDGILERIGRYDNFIRTEKPEVHMTLHTTKTLSQYMGAGITGFDRLDMLSFSELTPKDREICNHFRQLETPINYNKLIPNLGMRVDWDKEAAKLTEIAEFVDHIYLVIFKTPVGGNRDLVTRIGDRNRMVSDIMYIENLMGRVPNSVKNKITTDGCLRDTIQFSRTGFGCESNVSRVQVWPDGSVSGCPYAFSGSTKIGKSAEDIVANIREARKRYDFKDRCHLPAVYSSAFKQPGTVQS